MITEIIKTFLELIRKSGLAKTVCIPWVPFFPDNTELLPVFLSLDRDTPQFGMADTPPLNIAERLCR